MDDGEVDFQNPDQFYLDLALEGLNPSNITAWQEVISET